MLLEHLSTYIDYNDVSKMFDIVKNNNKSEIEEKIYVLEHKDVYTAGKSLSADNDKIITNINGTPVFYCDRGGLWTWHGKGQVIVYFIYNLRKHKMTISKFMNIVENSVINVVKTEINRYIIDVAKVVNIYADQEKRGFWVENLITHEVAKFGFIGLRVVNGYVIHGISINYNNSLLPFSFINPCGLGNIKISSIEEILQFCIINEQQSQKLILDINKFKLNLGSSIFTSLSEKN